MVYSTCSISDLENKGTVAEFIKENQGWEIAGAAAHNAIGSLPDGSLELKNLRRPDGFYATWPQYPEIDGFEAVVLRRV